MLLILLSGEYSSSSINLRQQDSAYTQNGESSLDGPTTYYLAFPQLYMVRKAANLILSRRQE